MAYKIAAVERGSAVDPCCCPTETCCLYPAQALEDGDLTALDLPAQLSIPVLGITNLALSGSTYTSGWWTLERPYPDLWRLWNDDLGGCSYVSGCLVGTYTPDEYHTADPACPTNPAVEDQFEAEYTGTYGVFDPITLTRISTCEWTGSGTGTEDQPYTVRLYYGTDYKWHIAVTISATDYDCIKGDYQSSPDADGGDYEGNFTVSI